VTCLLCCSCAKIAAVVAVAVAVGVAVVAAFAVVNVNLIKTNRLRNSAQMGATTVGRLAPGFFSPFFWDQRADIIARTTHFQLATPLQRQFNCLFTMC